MTGMRSVIENSLEVSSNMQNPLNHITLVGTLYSEPETNKAGGVRGRIEVQRPGHTSTVRFFMSDWGDDWGSTKESPKQREGARLNDFTEGDKVVVDGELVNRSYKVGEETKYIVEVQVRNIEAISDEDYKSLLTDVTVQALA